MFFKFIKWFFCRAPKRFAALCTVCGAQHAATWSSEDEITFLLFVKKHGKKFGFSLELIVKDVLVLVY